jgi:heme exporter protein A
LEGGTIFNCQKTLPILSAHGLACRRGKDWLFKEFSFEIHPGQVVWLRGQNGRGKTSLLRLLLRLSEPDAGTLIWDSLLPLEGANSRPQMVYVGHANGLKDNLTAAESVKFLAELNGLDCSPKRVTCALEKLGMAQRAHAKIRTLSQGQRRRVTLARLALEIAPALWVLDEPFDSLDAQGTTVVNTLMLDHIARGGSIFLTSHQPLSLEGCSVQTLEFPAGQA